MNPAAAKQFLISRVIEQAAVEHATISEIERKMLYFTEVSPSLPDMYEVNAEFERNYNADEYEEKIAGFLRNARDRDARESPTGERQWKDALDALKQEDHYILVMVSQAFGAGSSSGSGRRFRDFLIYVGVGIGLVLVLVLASIWRSGP